MNSGPILQGPDNGEEDSELKPVFKSMAKKLRLSFLEMVMSNPHSGCSKKIMEW